MCPGRPIFRSLLRRGTSYACRLHHGTNAAIKSRNSQSVGPVRATKSPAPPSSGLAIHTINFAASGNDDNSAYARRSAQFCVCTAFSTVLRTAFSTGTDADSRVNDGARRPFPAYTQPAYISYETSTLLISFDIRNAISLRTKTANNLAANSTTKPARPFPSYIQPAADIPYDSETPSLGEAEIFISVDIRNAISKTAKNMDAANQLNHETNPTRVSASAFSFPHPAADISYEIPSSLAEK